MGNERGGTSHSQGHPSHEPGKSKTLLYLPMNSVSFESMKRSEKNKNGIILNNR